MERGKGRRRNSRYSRSFIDCCGSDARKSLDHFCREPRDLRIRKLCGDGHHPIAIPCGKLLSLAIEVWRVDGFVDGFLHRQIC